MALTHVAVAARPATDRGPRRGRRARSAVVALTAAVTLVAAGCGSGWSWQK